MNRGRDTHAVWVFFTDDAARSAAPAAISDYTLLKRKQQGIGTFANDAPIPASLVEDIERTGARVREKSRWLRAVSVDADAAALRRIRKMNAVRGIRPVGMLVKTGASEASVTTTAPVAATNAATNAAANAATSPATNTATSPAAPASSVVAPFDSAYYGPNWPGIRQLGVPAANLAGFDGSGVRIALFDTGFNRNHETLRSRSVLARRDFINQDADVADEPGEDAGTPAVHGTRVWSIIGGFQPTELVGPAPSAQFILAKIDDEANDSRADEDRWVAAMEWSDSLGVHIINSSVAMRYFYVPTEIPYDSLDGDRMVVTRAADEAARRGILVVTAMGDAPTNEPGTLAAPADADSVISVGSIDRFGNIGVFDQGFSARGPTFDGRTKPELVALGTNMRGADSRTEVGFFESLSGTSYSTALMSGAAALFLQAWPEKPPSAVRRAFQLAGNRATRPDNTFGWGVPDVAAAILFPQGILLNTIDPVDLSGAATSIAPTFSWNIPETNPRMHPVIYRVQVARDTAFTNLLFTDTIREGLSLTARTPIEPAARLFWRVLATTPIGVTRASLPEQFRMPDWVRLLTLAGEQPTFSTTTQPELTWVPLDPRGAGPFTFDVQILAHGSGVIVQNIRNLSSSTVRVPAPLTPNQSFRWRVIARARDGQADTVETTQPFVVSTDDKPPATVLYQNFPNPFTGSDVTRIWFDLAADGPVQLSVHTLRGIMVRQLIPAQGCAPVTLTAGIYGRTGQVLANESCILLEWDGRNESGTLMQPDVYVLQLQANGKRLTKKILLTRNR